MIKKIIITFVTIILLSEILIGYLAFLNEKQINKDYFLSLPNLPNFINLIDRNKNIKKIEKFSLDEFKIYLNNKIKIDKENYFFDNPFLEDDIKGNGYLYHPFVEYTGVHSNKYKFDLDYFGFRNKKNYYFNKNNNYKIIMTGGSECAGYGHKKTIAELLENNFRKFYNSRKIDVINLCMNSYTVLNEIQSITNLGILLEPDIVISHSGYNDSLYSIFVPKNFFKIGLFYFIGQEQWKNAMYGKKIKTNIEIVNNETIKNFNPKLFFSATKKNYINFEKIVESVEANLIIGLQAYNSKGPSMYGNIPQQFHKIALLNMDELNKNFKEISLDGINFFDFYDELKFIDTIHTDNKTAEFIANEYFKYINHKFALDIKNKIH